MARSTTWCITGGTGQLGSVLVRRLVEQGRHVVALSGSRSDVIAGLQPHPVDVTDPSATWAILDRVRPSIVVHLAAITNIADAYGDPSRAHRVNVEATAELIRQADRIGARFVYASTDLVFDGASPPYAESARTNPLSVYGRTKAWAEQAVRDHLQRFYIVRIAWLYGDGPRNFVRTVLRLAQERDQIRMVTDEWGSPTYAGDVAKALDLLIRSRAYGIYHLPNSGVCSRYDWAREILERTGPHTVRLEPSTDYPRAARVPKQVAMANNMGAAIGIEMRSWQAALGQYLTEGRGG